MHRTHLYSSTEHTHFSTEFFFSKQNHETIRNETTHQIARWKEKCAKFPVCISICPVVADVLHFQAQANECNIFACLNLWISYVIDVWMTKYTAKIHVIINLWERRWWWCARQMEIKPKVDWMFDGNGINTTYAHICLLQAIAALIKKIPLIWNSAAIWVEISIWLLFARTYVWCGVVCMWTVGLMVASRR